MLSAKTDMFLCKKPTLTLILTPGLMYLSYYALKAVLLN